MEASLKRVTLFLPVGLLDAPDRIAAVVADAVRRVGASAFEIRIRPECISAACSGHSDEETFFTVDPETLELRPTRPSPQDPVPI